MPALDFPATPADGDIFGNWVYSSAKQAWQSRPLTPAKTINSPVAPSNPAAGDQWFNTDTGQLFIYYTDANTSQWVESRAPITADGYISPNYIINGAFEINQRNLTSTTATGYGFDRWFFTSAGGTTTHSTQSSAAGAGPTPDSPANFARTVTTGQSASSDLAYIAQRVEGVRTLAGKTVTVSFWAKAASAGARVSVELNQWFGAGGSSEINTPSGSISISTSWARYSVTMNVPSIFGRTIGTTDFLNVILWFSAGSTFATRSSSIGLQNNTFDVWGVQLEEGTVATPFRRNANSIQGELAACQRYFVAFPVNSYFISNPYFAVNLSGGPQLPMTPLPVPMRVAPTSVGTSAGAVNIPITYKSNTAGADSARNIRPNNVFTTNIEWMYSSEYNGTSQLSSSYAFGSNSQILWVSAEL